MHAVPEDYVERTYAGWLGKVIGVRHGIPIEGWTYERIEQTFGEITGYLRESKLMTPDDDTNGPLFFMRALRDYTHSREITPEQMGWTWLNYIPDGRGFLWWGGYGVSTEHTAYLNLKHGIPAPRSGSMEQNGRTVAEQIGGQIFSDVWGLLAPGQPELAAEYAGKMSSVSHDGNGKYGGMFIAACVAAAYAETDVHRIIESGLSVIPEDCEYARMVRDVVAVHRRHPDNWREGFRCVRDRYGYHRYPGNCHIIPNAAVVVLSLLYGKGDFSRSLNICNMCGWDTDCNAGNVGAILGVRNGLEGIPGFWREPVNDFLCCSSVIGVLNMRDLPQCACEIARLGYLVAGQDVPAAWKDILNKEHPYYHFEFPGSTHTFQARAENNESARAVVRNSDEQAFSGSRSLKVEFDGVNSGDTVQIFHRTYYWPSDFEDNRYQPAFSPLLYPGQTVTMHLLLPADAEPNRLAARLYVKDGNSGQRFYGEDVQLVKGQWTRLEYVIPAMADACIDEAGAELVIPDGSGQRVTVFADDIAYTGQPDYSVRFAGAKLAQWNSVHLDVSQCTCLRGLWQLEDGYLSGSYSGEPAECYTGDIRWGDLEYECVLIPKLGEHHRVLFRVQGAMRSYAVELGPDRRLCLYKNNNGYILQQAADFPWEHHQTYTCRVVAAGNHITVDVNGKRMIDWVDRDHPYLTGQVGFGNAGGSRTYFERFSVKGL